MRFTVFKEVFYISIVHLECLCFSVYGSKLDLSGL